MSALETATAPATAAALRIGAARCLILADGTLSAPAAFLFANAKTTELLPVLEAHGLAPASIPAGLNCLVIDFGGVRVLWDTGTGGRWHEGLGQLARQLEEADVSPASIDLVVLSHGHPDHIGGLIDAGGEPRFPRARHVMSEAEWRHWTDPRSLAGTEPAWAEVARTVLPPIADRLERIAAAWEIAPGLRLLPSPGHTPGHLALWLESRGETLLAVGDAVGHPLNVEHPDWLAASDGDPVRTPRTRRDLYARAADRGALVFANHFVFPGLGRIRRAGDGFVWEEDRP